MGNRRTLGTLLRHLVELLDGDVEKSYRQSGLDFRSRYTPVVRLLTEQGPSTIRAISNFAGITHSAASQTVAEMVKRGLAKAEAGEDGRERIIRLTAAAEAQLPELHQQWLAINAAAAELGEEIGIPLEDAISRAIAAVEERPFLARIEAHRARQPPRRRGATAKRRA
jgi:DNA-binding MarR family transcriptional regulator